MSGAHTNRSSVILFQVTYHRKMHLCSFSEAYFHNIDQVKYIYFDFKKN